MVSPIVNDAGLKSVAVLGDLINHWLVNDSILFNH